MAQVSTPTATSLLEAVPAIRPFLETLDQLRPAELDALDVHTHLGHDEDGRSLDVETLLAQLDEAGVRRACAFPLHDPDRNPAYRVPNDRVLAWAGQSGQRLVPFCRVDPADGPVVEAERCLNAGARGIKLHPRAQGFVFSDGAADAIFALAEERDVPILIHAGRGMPPIADGLADAALRHPGLVLILAHCGIADQGILSHRLRDHPGVLYDTSVFAPIDLIELSARVPPERIVFGSDPPYGRPLAGLYLVGRVGRALGLPEPTLRAMLGGTIASVLDGRGVGPQGDPAGPDGITLAGPLARVYAYGAMVFAALMSENVDVARGMLDLAVAAARDPAPRLAADAIGRIHAALAAASEILATASNRDQALPAIALVQFSIVTAATEPV